MGQPNMMATVARPASPVDATIPGRTRRRVWSAPAVTSHSLLALTFQKLHLAPAGSDVRPDTVPAIQNGGDLDAIFGPFGTVVDLASVTWVRFDLLKNSLTLEYPQGAGSGAIRSRGGKACAQVVIGFADHETADEVYTKIWRRLGDRVELKPYRRHLRELGRLPLAIMAGVLFATALLAVAANVSADGARGDGGLLAGLRRLDWRWVCGTGGAVLALLQVRVYRTFTKPPTHLELASRFPSGPH